MAGCSLPAMQGLNLAATDVKYLAGAFIEYFTERSAAGIDHYSARCLRRLPDEGRIAAKFQQAELDYMLNSPSARTTIAENYVGLPLDFGGG